MANDKLTPTQVAQLGGFAAARSLGEDGVKARGAKGAAVTKERYGKELAVRAAHARWGRKVKPVKPTEPFLSEHPLYGAAVRSALARQAQG